MPNKPIVNPMAPGKITALTIMQAAARMGLTPQYVRQLIRQNKIPTTQEPISPHSVVFRHMISIDTIEAFQAQIPSRSRRHDHRHKWTVYSTFEEMTRIKELLHEHGFDDVADMIRTTNVLKNKPPESEPETEDDDEGR